MISPPQTSCSIIHSKSESVILLLSLLEDFYQYCYELRNTHTVIFALPKANNVARVERLIISLSNVYLRKENSLKLKWILASAMNGGPVARRVVKS